MKIAPIFADIQTEQPIGLFGIVIAPEKDAENEYDKLLYKLYDRVFLYNFFKNPERQTILKRGYYSGTSMSDAIRKTFKEIKRFESDLKSNYDRGLESLIYYLNIKFKALDNSEYRSNELQKVKSRGNSNKNWIRIYAVRVSKDFYIITGGGVKLTKFIQEDADLDKERRKLNRVTDFLKEEGLYDPESFKELIIDL